jgi:hypothetical protein
VVPGRADVMATAADGALRARALVRRLAGAPLPPDAVLWDLSMAFARSRLLAAVVRHGVHEELARGPATAATLAERRGLDADALHRVLRALAVDGVVRLDRRGRFRLTRVGRRLGHLADWIIYLDDPSTQAAWAGLGDTLRTGEPSFPATHGRSVWRYFAEHPELEARFASAMRSVSEIVLPFVAPAYPWPERGTVADVAGGVGTLLEAVLRDRPDLRGVLVDAPGVLREADGFLTRAGVRDRVELREGDIFERVDAEADVYLLKDVLHDWDDERSVAILRIVRATMAPGSRVVLVEGLQERDRPDPVQSLVDVQMLTQVDGGRQRSEAELHALLRDAALEPGATYRTAGPALVEGVAR